MNEKSPREISLEIGLAIQKCALNLDDENFEKIKPYLETIRDDVIELVGRLPI